MAKHTLKEIMQMNLDDLEECIAAMSTDDPRLNFALKQRDFLSQRHSHKLTVISIAVGMVMLFILVSGYVAEASGISLRLANWTIIFAMIFIVVDGIVLYGRLPEHLVLAQVEIRTFQQKIIAFTPVPFQLMPMDTQFLTTHRKRRGMAIYEGLQSQTARELRRGSPQTYADLPSRRSWRELENFALDPMTWDAPSNARPTRRNH